jgi:hypothetical protein
MKNIYRLLFSIFFIAVAGIHAMETPDIFELTASEASQPSTASGWHAAPQVIVRDDFFEDVVGMSESKFRHKYVYHHGKLQNPPHNLSNWIKEFPRRAAIFQGQFMFETIETMDTTIGRHLWPS